jgi:hypothetical protein
VGIRLRRILFITSGKADAETWAAAACEEEPTRGPVKACAACPLRKGGEWEAGAAAAIAEQTPAQRATMRRWGCHDNAGPCAGMRRLLAEAAGQ